MMMENVFSSLFIHRGEDFFRVYIFVGEETLNFLLWIEDEGGIAISKYGSSLTLMYFGLNVNPYLL
jgi:hypothetical protein